MFRILALLVVSICAAEEGVAESMQAQELVITYLMHDAADVTTTTLAPVKRRLGSVISTAIDFEGEAAMAMIGQLRDYPVHTTTIVPTTHSVMF